MVKTLIGGLLFGAQSLAFAVGQVCGPTDAIDCSFTYTDKSGLVWSCVNSQGQICAPAQQTVASYWIDIPESELSKIYPEYTSGARDVGIWVRATNRYVNLTRKLAAYPTFEVGKNGIRGAHVFKHWLFWRDVSEKELSEALPEFSANMDDPILWARAGNLYARKNNLFGAIPTFEKRDGLRGFHMVPQGVARQVNFTAMQLRAVWPDFPLDTPPTFEVLSRAVDRAGKNSACRPAIPDYTWKDGRFGAICFIGK